VCSTFSPVSATRRKRTTSRTRRYGCSNGIAFHRSTITLLLEPMPMATRPGAASARPATVWASAAGARVNAGTIAVPRRSRGSQAAASASGVNASRPSDSADQTSV
jgi:hypothetical protein